MQVKRTSRFSAQNGSAKETPVHWAASKKRWCANVIFRNNVRGTHTAEATTTVSLIANGTTIQIPKQPVRGGAGGNPIISVRFLDGQGNPIGDAVTLGKCNKI
jgi:hypothetical protein